MLTLCAKTHTDSLELSEVPKGAQVVGHLELGPLAKLLSVINQILGAALRTLCTKISTVTETLCLIMCVLTYTANLECFKVHNYAQILFLLAEGTLADRTIKWADPVTDLQAGVMRLDTCTCSKIVMAIQSKTMFVWTLLVLTLELFRVQKVAQVLGRMALEQPAKDPFRWNVQDPLVGVVGKQIRSAICRCRIFKVTTPTTR